MKTTTIVALTLIAAFLAIGCVGTLEETRGEIRVASPSARTSGECAKLSSRERTWGAVAATSAALSGASGLATIPVSSHGADVGLTAGVVVLSATAVGALTLEQSYGREWTRSGCSQ